MNRRRNGKVAISIRFAAANRFSTWITMIKPIIFLIVTHVLVGASATAIAQNELPAEKLRTPVEKEVERTIQDTLLQADQSVFISSPREFLRPLIRANRAIAENDPSA